MTKFRPAAILCASLATMLLVSGCNRSVSALDVPPASLPPAPLDPVQSQPLDPVTGQPMQPPPGQPGDNTQIATAGPDAATQPPQSMSPPASASSEPITRESMAGTWTVASDNPDCRIILAFTKWSGGYRAATRRCNTPELAGVTAWDVKGNQVVLVDGTGNTVATLYSTGPERYDGQTNSGKAIRFTR